MEHRTWESVPEERMNALITRRVFHTDNLTMARIALSKGAVVPLHQHVSEQVTSVESGRLVLKLQGREIILEPGAIFAIDANVPHELEALEDTIANDVFAPRREDWIRGDDAYLRR